MVQKMLEPAAAWGLLNEGTVFRNEQGESFLEWWDSVADRYAPE